MSTITLVSGANRGLGYCIASRLARDHGHHVITGSRDANEGAKIAALLSITAATKIIEEEFGPLDVLINNAGILLDREIPDQNPRDPLTKTFSTNVIGTACLTEASVPLLRKSTLPRVVFVSSRMGSLAEATNRDTPYFATDDKAYDSSKAAVNMLALNYAWILEDVKGHVNAGCPGLVSTRITKHTENGESPYIAAQFTVELAALLENGPNATFSDKNGRISW